MTACVMRFAVPPEGLAIDVSRYMEPEVGPTWPQEAHDVVLHDLKPELQGPDGTELAMKQLESRGFAVIKNSSKTLGPLESHTEWNTAYLEVNLNIPGSATFMLNADFVLSQETAEYVSEPR